MDEEVPGRENTRLICGCQDYDASIGIKAINLSQNLIQRLFTLIVATPKPAPR